MLFRGAAMAAAIGLVNSIGNLGGFLGPNVVGVAKTLTGGTTGAFLVLALLGVLSAVSLLALRRHAAFRAPAIIAPLVTRMHAGIRGERA